MDPGGRAGETPPQAGHFTSGRPAAAATATALAVCRFQSRPGLRTRTVHAERL
jgi:hypothetical protein